MHVIEDSLSNLTIQHYINNEIPTIETGNDNTFLYINIRSIRDKLHDLELILQAQNSEFRTLIHIIAVTEIWI